MQVLQAKVNILDVAVLDQVEARLQVRGGAGGVTGPGRDLGGHRWIWGLTSAPLPLQSVLGKVNEMAKHKAMAQDTDTQSKVRAGGGDDTLRKRLPQHGGCMDTPPFFAPFPRSSSSTRRCSAGTPWPPPCPTWCRGW